MYSHWPQAVCCAKAWPAAIKSRATDFIVTYLKIIQERFRIATNLAIGRHSLYIFHSSQPNGHSAPTHHRAAPSSLPTYGQGGRVSKQPERNALAEGSERAA